MRSLSGPKYPDKNADPIIVHPAVRSMLMTQKAFSEGGRALAYFWLSMSILWKAQMISNSKNTPMNYWLF